jgi:hypothetical protein
MKPSSNRNRPPDWRSTVSTLVYDRTMGARNGPEERGVESIASRDTVIRQQCSIKVKVTSPDPSTEKAGLLELNDHDRAVPAQPNG